MLSNYLRRVRAAIAAITTPEWRAEFVEASLRQGQNVAIPFLIVVIQTGRVDLALATGLALQLAGGQIVVLARRLAALTVAATAPLLARIAARALSAFAGAVLGYVLVVPVAGILSLEWPTIVVSAVGSTVLSLLNGWYAPAASDVVQGEVFAVDGVPVGALGGETDDIDHDVDPAGRGA